MDNNIVLEAVFTEGSDVKVKYRLKESITLCNITIPSGFKSDGASVPRVFWGFFPPIGKYLPAAILHDYLLSQKYEWSIALDYFNEALKECSVSYLTRKVMVLSIKIYGYLFK